MSRQVSPATDRVYGLQRVTRVWGIARPLGSFLAPRNTGCLSSEYRATGQPSRSRRR